MMSLCNANLQHQWSRDKRSLAGLFTLAGEVIRPPSEYFVRRYTPLGSIYTVFRQLLFVTLSQSSFIRHERDMFKLNM